MGGGRKREGEDLVDRDSTRTVRRRTDEEGIRPRKRNRPGPAGKGGGQGERVGSEMVQSGLGDDVQGLGDPTPWLREPPWMPTWLHRRPMTETGDMTAIAVAASTATQTADTIAAAAAAAEQTGASAAAAEALAQDDDDEHGQQSAMAVDEDGQGHDGGGAREAGERTGDHSLLQTGPLVFCSRCGAYAIDRVGARLAGKCHKSTSRATKLRLERMRQGRHPLTGDPVA